MGDLLKQTLTLALGAIIAGSVMLFLERGDAQRPEVTAIVQHAELNEDFLGAFFEYVVSRSYEGQSDTEEQLDDVEVQNIASDLLYGSGLRHGGSLEVYYIENNADNRAYDIVLQGRDFEYAVILEETKTSKLQEGVAYPIRLLPSQHLRAVVVTDRFVSTSAPHHLINDQRLFASIEEHTLPFIRLANFSPHETAPEAWVKKSPAVAVVFSLLGAVFIILIAIAAILSLLTRKNIQFYASLMSADELARSRLAFDFLREKRPSKFKQVEAKIEELRDDLPKPEDSGS